MFDVKMCSKSTNDDGLELQPNELIQQNISAILSNGVHCSYLLNTMSNPSTLPYSNYTFGGSGYAHNKHNNQPNQTTPLNIKSNTNTTTSTSTVFDERIGPLTSNCNTEQDMISNMNINNNIHHPLYIYSQNINHHYPQHQHHHYHLFQMAQHQSVGHYPLNPYTKYSANNTYILNPYDPNTTTTPTPPQQNNSHQTPPPNTSSLMMPNTIYDEGSKDTNPANNDEMASVLTQIVSIPDEFASAVNENFSEKIGMQYNEENIAPSTTIHKYDKYDKYDDEAFISKRKQQIISFLSKWDTSYPNTSQNGESNSKEGGSDVPPGLHKMHKIKDNEEEGNDESPKYFLESPSYKFCGSFIDAKIAGIRDNKWIMLNIQDTDLFTAQWSNPLIWKHKRYGLIIASNFIFFNVVKFDDSAIDFINLYNIQNVPSVCIIDPHSNLKQFEFVAPSTSSNIVKLRKDILDLLNKFPNPIKKARKPPIPHKSSPSSFHFTSSLSISSSAHIYCCPSPSSNIWDLCYPYTNLKNNAYILSTRQTFDWNDWMLIIKKSAKIIGAIPSEQHIEFLRNRNGEMTLESSGTYNGWWSEQRIAEYVVNEKFGLSFEGGFASENGRKRKRFLKSLELPRRPTFKKMLVIIPNINTSDRALFHENSLSMTSYLEYDKMDNITSFQLWLSFITYLSVNMFETSQIYQSNQIKYNECTNFCIKLGSKWKLPLTTLYNDIEPLINNEKCKETLFSFPKIATDATTHCSSSSHSTPHSINVLNKYHNPTANDNENENIKKAKNPGLEIAFLTKQSKRTNYVKSYQGLESALIQTKPTEIIDFPFPLCSSGWFSFNTLSLFATILEQHLNGSWVSMFSLNSRKQFKQIFDINKNTRRRSIMYTKLLQQKINEENYKTNYINLSKHLNTKNKKRLKSFWNENRLYWTDLIIDPTNKTKYKTQNEDECCYHKNHNNRNYRKKRKPRFRNRIKKTIK